MSNEFLDNYLQKLNEQESIQEGKFRDIADFIKNNSGKFKDTVRAFLQLGANIGVGWVVGGIGGIILGFVVRGKKYLEDIIDNISKRQEYIPDIPEGSDYEAFKQMFHRTWEHIVAISNTTEATYCAVYGVLAAIAFTILQQRFKEPEKAKSQVAKLLKKNDKLDKRKQKICNKLAKEVYEK